MSGRTEFPENLPNDNVKIWTISLSKDPTDPRLTVECNGVQVVDFLASETCTSDKWTEYWKNDVAEIQLSSPKGALEGFRPAAG